MYIFIDVNVYFNTNIKTIQTKMYINPKILHS